MEQIRLFNDDCLNAMKQIPDNSVDSIITDPPYHLTSIVKRFGKEGSAPAQFGTDGAYARASKGFMGKEWDGGDISFRTEIWEECLRVLKPGGHLLSFSHSRTYHRMAVAIEDAGFEIRDQIMWVYGSGFPKSHNIGKAIDKLQGNDREVVGIKGNYRDMRGGALDPNLTQDRERLDIMETKGNSLYEGWGTALKPAHEPIVMARKPFKGSVAENVLKYGTGGINIDESRIGYKDENDKQKNTDGLKRFTEYRDKIKDLGYGFNGGETYNTNTDGRWPANIIFDEEAGKILDEQSGESKSAVFDSEKYKSINGFKSTNNIFGKSTKDLENSQGYSDKGGASRFFYCPKANKKDRNEGCEDLEDKGYSINQAHNSKSLEERYELKSKNNHPTVKPTKLMEYLIKLVTPKNGIVLDPFMGSGSTGKAAIKNNFGFIGIEREIEYFEIAKARIKYENKI